MDNDNRVCVGGDYWLRNENLPYCLGDFKHVYFEDDDWTPNGEVFNQSVQPDRAQVISTS